MRWRCSCIGLVACVSAIAAFAWLVSRREGVCEDRNPANGGIPPAVRFVAAGIADARSKLRCARATVQHVQTTSKAVRDILRSVSQTFRLVGPIDSDDVQERRATWFLRGGELSMAVVPEQEASPGSGLRSVRIVADEDRAQVLYEYAGSQARRLGNVLAREELMPKGLWSEYEMLDPRYYAYCRGARPLDEALLDPALSASYEGDEVVDGSQCMKVALRLGEGKSRKEEYWIDTDHGYIVRRYRKLLPFHGQSYVQCESSASKLVESKGVWLPGLFEETSFLHKTLLPEYKGTDPTAMFVAGTKRAIVTEFQVDCEFPPGIFEMQWPPGTRVHDQVEGTTVVVGKDAAEKGGHAETEEVPAPPNRNQ